MRLCAVVLMTVGCLLTGTTSWAQGGAVRPTTAAVASTPAQDALIKAGSELHDQGKFDDAIAKYQEALRQNPANVAALYELAYSYVGKKDYAQAIATARRGAQYASDLLPLFYDEIASAYDASGDPQKAVETYQQGIALSPKASQLYYNLAVTYRQSLKQPAAARTALQQALRIDPMLPSAHLLLGEAYQSGGNATAAFLALSTFLLIDPAGQDATQGYAWWRQSLKGGAAQPGVGGTDGAATMRTAGSAPATGTAAASDTGGDVSYAATDRQILVSHKLMMDRIESQMPEAEALIAQIDSVIQTLNTPPAGSAASFSYRFYAPFYLEMRRRKFVEPYVYWVSQRAPVPNVREWLTANEPKVREFLQWASTYPWPTW